MQPGNHTINFNAKNLEPGIYLYNLQLGDYNEVNKMVIMK